MDTEVLSKYIYIKYLHLQTLEGMLQCKLIFFSLENFKVLINEFNFNTILLA